MNVAVMTLTRDRLEYTAHCFESLREHAGCPFDHYVLDNGSQDETPLWLERELDANRLMSLALLPNNIGCCRGWNEILEELLDPDDYDIVVCFDNDCEVVEDDTLLRTCEAALRENAILSPRVEGLRNPPPTLRERHEAVCAGAVGEVFLETAIVGNVFMAIPAALLTGTFGYRWDERQEVWAGGEAISAWWRSLGGWCGYLRDLHVNHYETTDGQHVMYPWYFERRVAEGGPA